MRKYTLCIATVALMLMSGVAHAITYSVNRTIGAGSVTGYIETDGTLGLLSSGNITDWAFTLSAPNLAGGSPDLIEFATPPQLTVISGLGTTATASQILFDFNIGGSFIGFQGASTNFWCLDTLGLCTETGEHIGRNNIDGSNAQSAYYDGQVVIASVSVIPLPIGLPLFAGGLGLLGLMHVRSKRKALVAESHRETRPTN